MRTVSVSLPDVFYADPSPTNAEQCGDLAAATFNMALEHLLRHTEELRLVGEEISDDGTDEDLDGLYRLDRLAEEEECARRILRPLTENKAAVFISPAVLPLGVLLPTEKYRDSVLHLHLRSLLAQLHRAGVGIDFARSYPDLLEQVTSNHRIVAPETTSEVVYPYLEPWCLQRFSRCITPLPSLKKGIAAVDTGKKLSEQADELLRAHRIPRQQRDKPEFEEDAEPNMTETPPDWRGVLQHELDIKEEEQVRTFIQRVERASVGEYGNGDEVFEAADGENW
mmetsp:Transcript_25599/g.64489  ORF Transcript_25599/g.64489 Transcript_25599/m.64489 type:complete len:282 (+) Transcript_25599:1047-1892(+)